MDFLAMSDVETLAKQVAEELAGAGSVVHVQVDADIDSTNEPAYFISFNIKHGGSFSYQPAELRLRLAQELRDRLMARGDTRYPFINRLGLQRDRFGD